MSCASSYSDTPPPSREHQPFENCIDDYDDNDDDNQRGVHNDQTTAVQTYLHLVKGYVGPGCLSLPWAFGKLGVLNGIVACIVISFWSSYNCWTMVRLKRRLLILLQEDDRQTVMIPNTYPQLGGWAYGTNFENFVTLSIIIQQLAICTVFLSFVGENVYMMAVALSTRGDMWWLSHSGVITLVLPAVIALSCLPNLRQLAPVTWIGTMSLFLALGFLGIVILQHCHDDDNMSPPHQQRQPPSLSQFPLALCAILYSYEGICLILPVEGAMQSPQHFPKVFWGAMGTVCLVFCTVATCTILVFGTVNNGSVTAYLLTLDNFQGRNLVLFANWFVTLSVVLTYPLQLFPCLELVGQWIVRRRQHRGQGLPMDEVGLVLRDEDSDMDGDSIDRIRGIPGDSAQMRLALVLLTYVIAIVIPNVQQLISLAGALAGSSTALLIPPLIELKYIQSTSANVRDIVKCHVLFIVGLIFCIIGTGTSILDIIQIFVKQ